MLLLSALTPALVAPAPALNVTSAADPPTLLAATAAALIVALAAPALALLVPAAPALTCAMPHSVQTQGQTPQNRAAFCKHLK